MKTLALILALSNGDTERHVLPAWECRQMQALLEHTAAVGGYMARDDGARVVNATCEDVPFAETLSPSDGPCEELS